ncbi:MAG: acyl-ACP--UDP-N-acetylglucosamine O-acyltransferase [Proteobacteria bacterium]|nr:acyl-ACP--UDP-N-acetylglucosamine O-acyltransferase [Pseudomonadota bacterium]
MSSVEIHPTSIIEKGAELDVNVKIGPFCRIGAQVKLAKGNHLHSHVVIEGNTTLGADNQIFPFVCLGAAPQDLGYKGEATQLIIGSANTFRESFTAHRASAKADGKTEIGNKNFFMAYCHVAHDCKIGNQTIMANYTALAGHVIVEDFVNISGHSGVQQKARIGSYGFLAGATELRRDLAPFMAARGDSEVVGPNLVGLKRAGFNEVELRCIREIYKIFYKSPLTAEKSLEKIRELYSQEKVAQIFLNFVGKTVIGVQR